MVSKTNASTPDLAPNTPMALCSDAADIVSSGLERIATRIAERRAH